MSQNNQSEGKQVEQFIVRFVAGQRSTIKARAASNKRSMNAEILVLIEAGMTNTDRGAVRAPVSRNS